MHTIQEKLLNLSAEKNLGTMTLREIGALVGEKLPQKIKHHLSQLERKGFLKINRAGGKIERVSENLRGKGGFLSIPIVGTANCGPATIFADQNIEGYLKVSPKMLGRKRGVFAIHASGLSMNKAAVAEKVIEDGDYLIIDKEDTSPRNGDIVVSIIEETATVKRFYWDKENKQVVLMADSTREYPPIYIHEDDQFSISGKVVQVIKKPKIAA